MGVERICNGFGYGSHLDQLWLKDGSDKRCCRNDNKETVMNTGLGGD